MGLTLCFAVLKWNTKICHLESFWPPRFEGFGPVSFQRMFVAERVNERVPKIRLTKLSPKYLKKIEDDNAM